MGQLVCMEANSEQNNKWQGAICSLSFLGQLWKMRTVFPSLRQNASVSVACVSQRCPEHGLAAPVALEVLYPPAENQGPGIPTASSGPGKRLPGK